MSLNLTSVLKISIEAIGKENLRDLSAAVKNLESTAKGAKEGLKAIVSSDAFKAAAAAAAGLGVAIHEMAKEAEHFDSAIREVTKLIPEIQSPEGMRNLKQDINEIARILPLTREEIAQMYAAAASSGIATNEIKEFTKNIGLTAIAWDASAQAAATAIAQIKTALNLDFDGIFDLVGAINQVSQDLGIASMELVEFMTRAGATGKMAGFAGKETAAFGAAMIAAGNSAAVSATSFKAMVNAFSSGEGATDRQIAALRRLGYGMDTVASSEENLTRIAKAESQRRIDAINIEVDGKLRALDREIRERKRRLQDAWAEEDDANVKAINRRFRGQSIALDRQMERELDALRTSNGKKSDVDKERIYAVEDKYRAMRDALQDSQDKELRDYRIAQRDKRTAITDAIDDEKDLRARAIREMARQQIELEKEVLKQRLADAKETARATAEAFTKQLAKDFNEKPVQVVNEFFAKLRALPKEEQNQVFRQFFGDSASALLPLLDNVGLLEDALLSVYDPHADFNSVIKEATPVLESMASKTILAKRAQEEMALALGHEFRRASLLFLQAVTPILELINWFIQNVPGAKIVISALAVAFVGLVAALPLASSILGIAASIKTLTGKSGFAGLKQVLLDTYEPLKRVVQRMLGMTPASNKATSAIVKFNSAGSKGPAIWGKFVGLLKKIPALFMLIKTKVVLAISKLGYFLAGKAWVKGLVYGAGWAVGKAVAIFAGLGALIAKALGVVGAILSGPVGWVLLAAGLIALIVGFRKQIGDFFVWVGTSISNWVSGVWDYFEPLRMAFAHLWNEVLREPIMGFFGWIGEQFNTYLIQPVINAGNAIMQWAVEFWNTHLREPITGFFTWLGEGLYSFFVEPWVNVYTQLQTFVAEQWEKIREPIVGFGKWIGQYLYAVFVEPFVASFGFIQERWGNLWQMATDTVNNIWIFWSTLFVELFGEPFKEEIEAVRQFFVDAWNGIAEFFSQILSGINTFFQDYFVTPIADGLSAIGEWFKQTWESISSGTQGFLETVAGWFDTYFVQPIQSTINKLVTAFQNVWNNIADAAGRVWDRISDAAAAGADRVREIWNGISGWFKDNVVTPIQGFWDGLMDGLKDAIQSLSDSVQGIWEGIKQPIEDVMKSIGDGFKQYVSDPIKAAWDNTAGRIIEVGRNLVDGIAGFFKGLVDRVVSAWNGFVEAIQSAVNQVIGVVNKIIRAVNKARNAVGMGNIPEFANGGYVTQATVGLIGEAGPEYVIPADRMKAAALAYLQGQRGEAVVNARDTLQPQAIPTTQPANARVPLSRSGGGDRAPAVAGVPQVNITTGQVVQLDGADYVSKEDLIRATNDAVRQTYQQVMGDLRQPSTRQRLGIN